MDRHTQRLILRALAVLVPLLGYTAFLLGKDSPYLGIEQFIAITAAVLLALAWFFYDMERK